MALLYSYIFSKIQLVVLATVVVDDIPSSSSSSSPIALFSSIFLSISPFYI
jgi:hypothetical protein